MSNRTQLPSRLAAAGLVILAFTATSCGDDNPQNPPTTGSVQVSASTTGDDLDDGYTVSLDGGAGQALTINGSVTFTNQSVGSHTVELTGVSANCTVVGDNPRTVAVTAGVTVTTTFDVTCSATAGELDVTTATAGDNIDVDGYTVSVDGGAAQAIEVNGTLTVTGLDAGDHSVELGDVAANCTVAGDNPRTVAISGGGTATTQFDVTCTLIPPATGNVKVVNVTTGNAPDDAYTVTVDILGTPQPLAANDSLTITGLTVNDHLIELGDVAANCTVAGENPRTVTVTDGGEVRVQFDVNCQAGSLDVTSNTWGLGLDTGYEIVIDGGTPQTIGNNATVSTSDLSVDDHTVELTGIASNCSVDGTNPRTVAVTDGATSATTFDVFCFQTLNNQIAFETDRDGPAELYVRSGTNFPVNLSRNSPAGVPPLSSDDRNPDVAANGSVIVFDSNRGGTRQLWTMSEAGIRKFSTTAAGEMDPSFSGDPSGLAYARKTSSTNWEIWRANNDASGQRRLSSTAGENVQPSYSPDGQWVLFRSDRDGNQEVYVVNVATGVETNLTNNAAADGKPAWWYDGTKVLWTSDRTGNFEVFVADFDALTPALGVETNLTNNPGVDGFPDMRGNGASIAFTTDRDGTFEVYTMHPDGSNQTRFAGSVNGDDVNPSWSP